MAEEIEPKPRRRVLWVVLALLIAAAGARPFLPYQGKVPLQRDSMTWIEQTAPEAETRWDWTFRQSHFIGYRPATALSFAAGHALHGDNETALRAIDLALHVLVGMALFALAASLFGPLPALLGATLFFAHPAADQVVPFIARRSYSLSTLLALVALWLASRAGKVAPFLAGPIALAAMFAHELGAVVALALPAIMLTRSSSARRRCAVIAWVGACLAFGLWVRSGVMHGVDGYPIGDDFDERVRNVARAFATSLGGRLSNEGAPWLVALALLGLSYTLRALQLAIQRRLAPLLLLVALLAYGAIVASEAVWFPRQAYGAVALLGLFAASVQRESRGWYAVLPLALVSFVLWHSPAVRGTAPERLARAQAATAFVTGVREAAADLEEPASLGVIARFRPEESVTAFVVAPSRKGGRVRKQRHLRMPFLWLKRSVGVDGITLRDIAYVDAATGEAEFVREPRPELRLGDGTVAFVVRGGSLARARRDQRTIRVRPGKKENGASFAWSNLGEGAALVEIPPRKRD